jgi:hypothetical protein
MEATVVQERSVYPSSNIAQLGFLRILLMEFQNTD